MAGEDPGVERAGMNLPALPAGAAPVSTGGAGAPADASYPSERAPGRWRWRRRQAGPRTIRAALFRPIGIALATLLLVFGLLSIGTGYVRSYLRHLDYSQAAHQDGSLIGSGVQPALGDQVALSVRSGDQLSRHLTDRGALTGFLAERQQQLEQQRAALHAAASADADLVLQLAFADGPQQIEHYADWFFAWKTSYVMLKETVMSAVHRALDSGIEDWREAIERDLTDYFMRNFTERVLQPERRDPLLEAGVRNALQHAHERYLQAVRENDLRLQLFLQEHTRHLDRNELAGNVQVQLDWDAQKWKAPLYRADERSFAGMTGLGTVAGATLAGRMVGRALAPALQPLVRRTAQKVASGVAVKAGERAAGAAVGAEAGSAVAPGVGSAVGAVIGLAAGVALDYTANRVDRWLNRAEFVQENQAALAAIEQEWRGAIEQELHRTIDVWFDDSAAALQTLAPAPGPALGS